MPLQAGSNATEGCPKTTSVDDWLPATPEVDDRYRENRQSACTVQQAPAVPEANDCNGKNHQEAGMVQQGPAVLGVDDRNGEKQQTSDTGQQELLDAIRELTCHVSKMIDRESQNAVPSLSNDDVSEPQLI